MTTTPPSKVLLIRRYPPAAEESVGRPIDTLIHVTSNVPGALDRSSPTEPPLVK